MTLPYDPPKPIGRILGMLLAKQERLKDLERAYFAQFSGDVLYHLTCDNCGATFLAEKPRPIGQPCICCVHCMFNPLGCRCQFGEYGVAETVDYSDLEDDEYPDEWEDDNDYD